MEILSARRFPRAMFYIAGKYQLFSGREGKADIPFRIDRRAFRAIARARAACEKSALNVGEFSRARRNVIAKSGDREEWGEGVKRLRRRVDDEIG